MNAPVPIVLERLSATFHHPQRGDLVAVREIDLNVRAGELLTLLGPSGCGKTTTLRMIAGFQDPSGGRILIGGEDVTAVPANGRDIGLVFQNYALFPHLCVFDNVAYGLKVRRRTSSQIRAEVDAALALVGLQGLGDRQIAELSGGQQQRVALARAIVIRPRVLLFDEPLSNLDAKLRVQVRAEIARLQRDLGITTVYVTHDQEEAMAISDRIAVMEAGRVAQIGTAEDLYRRPASAFVAGFLGRTNLVSATVGSVGPGQVVLSLEGAQLTLSSDADLKVGSRLQAVIRPEAVTLEDRAPASSDLVGTVRGRVYLGDKVEYSVEVGREVVHVVRSNPLDRDLYSVGQRVAVILPTEGVQLLPDTGAA